MTVYCAHNLFLGIDGRERSSVVAAVYVPLPLVALVVGAEILDLTP